MERKIWDGLFDNVAQNLGEEYSLMLVEELASIVGKTDFALKTLGVEYDVEPKSIPGVNTIQNLRPLSPKEMSVTEVLGMPGATKTTICERLESLNLPHVVIAKEPFGILETLGIGTRGKKSTEEITNLHLQTYGATLMEVEDAVLKLTDPATDETKGIVVADRSLRDHLVWAGNLLLNGYISLENYYKSLALHDLTRKLVKVGEAEDEYIAKSIFVLMVNPETSLSRKGRLGGVLNERFLSLLYSQYLRLIVDLEAEGQNNLVVLDMSEDLESSFQKFMTFFKQIYN